MFEENLKMCLDKKVLVVWTEKGEDRELMGRIVSFDENYLTVERLDNKQRQIISHRVIVKLKLLEVRP